MIREQADSWAPAGILPASALLLLSLTCTLLLAACTAPPPEEPSAASTPDAVANWRTNRPQPLLQRQHPLLAHRHPGASNSRRSPKAKRKPATSTPPSSSPPPSTAAPTWTLLFISPRAATTWPRSRSIGSSSPASSSTSTESAAGRRRLPGDRRGHPRFGKNSTARCRPAPPS